VYVALDEGEKSGEGGSMIKWLGGRMIKWLGENGGELKSIFVCKKEDFVYKLDSFVGFIGDEQLHAQECYEGMTMLKKIAKHPNSMVNSEKEPSSFTSPH
jgi:hypothetical protein